MPRHILVVDDDPDLCEMISMMLEDIGCEVQSAHCGVSALATLDRDPEITLLLTDIQMPEMDGYDLAQRATSLRPGLSIVFMSGTDHGRTGFPFVPKPFSRAQLEEVVGPGCLEGCVLTRFRP